jgi:DNA polymerase III subunit alpha
LKVTVKLDDMTPRPDIARMLRDFAPRREETELGSKLHGLPVVFEVIKEDGEITASGPIPIQDGYKFFPSDAALASWIAQAYAGDAQIVYAS